MVGDFFKPTYLKNKKLHTCPSRSRIFFLLTSQAKKTSANLSPAPLTTLKWSVYIFYIRPSCRFFEAFFLPQNSEKIQAVSFKGGLTAPQNFNAVRYRHGHPQYCGRKFHTFSSRPINFLTPP